MPPRRGERGIEAVLVCMASVCVLGVLCLIAFLVFFSLPFFSQFSRLAEILSWTWNPTGGQYGILPMVAGSFFLAASSLLLAYPVGLGISLFVHGLGPGFLALPVMAVVRFMTGIPTVVYGFVSVFLLAPLLRELFLRGTGYSWLTASLTLAILLLPTVVLLIEAQFQTLESALRLTVGALGLTRAQGALHLVLPLSGRGLMAAAVLSFGRAIGDTLTPLMLAGNAAHLPHSPLDSLRTLTAHIALVVATDSQSKAYDSLFAAGLILLGTSAAVNLWLRSLRRKAGT